MATDPGDDLDVLAGEAGIVREVFESMPLMLIGLTGPRHRVDAVNLAYRAVFGRPAIVGMPVSEVFPEVEGQQLFEILDRVFETGVPQVASGWRVQTRNPATGELEERYVDFTMVPRRAPSGTIAGLNVFAVETTGQVLERQRLRQQAAAADERYEQARDVITALQRQLLPPGLPVLPSVQIAASYLLADADDAAGGDWFDAVPVPGGRVALVVGDVVGHGVAASAAMGQLRAVMQDRLDDTGDITAAMAAADRMARRVPGARAATVCLVLLDPADGTLMWCSAGHPPPLVAGPDRARFLSAPGHGPLGTGASYAVLHDRLGPGEVVLLYSDGIIERPGRTSAEASAELSQAVAGAVAGRGYADISRLPAADRACTQTLEVLVRQTGHADDITLLAAQRADPVPPVRLTRRAGQAPISAARAAVDAWTGILGASEQDRVALAHAVVELVTNACEHARPGTGDATITVAAGLRDDGEAWLAVTDDGRWRERARPGDAEDRRGQGYGLAMTAALADHLDIDRGEAGTTVTVRRRVSRSSRLLTADQISQGHARAAGDQPAEMVIAVQPDAPGSRITIRGPLDARTVEDLGTELDRLTLGGSHELTVDLAAVTHLASAAVAELYRTRPGTGTRRYPLRLYAPAGSIAHHVLSLVGLPHATQDPHRHREASPAGTEPG